MGQISKKPTWHDQFESDIHTTKCSHPHLGRLRSSYPSFHRIIAWFQRKVLLQNKEIVEMWDKFRRNRLGTINLSPTPYNNVFSSTFMMVTKFLSEFSPNNCVVPTEGTAAK